MTPEPQREYIITGEMITDILNSIHTDDYTEVHLILSKVRPVSTTSAEQVLKEKEQLLDAIIYEMQFVDKSQLKRGKGGYSEWIKITAVANIIQELEVKLRSQRGREPG